VTPSQKPRSASRAPARAYGRRNMRDTQTRRSETLRNPHRKRSLTVTRRSKGGSGILRLLRCIFWPPRPVRRRTEPIDYSYERPHPGAGNWHGLSNGHWLCGTCGGIGTKPSNLTGREITCGDCKGRPYR